MTVARGRLAGILSLGAIAFVLGHDLVFLATYGSGYWHGLRETGHDVSWTVLAASALLVSGSVAIAAGWRLRRLARLVDELENGRIVVAGGGARRLGRRVLGLWVAVAPSAVALFVLAENIEHLRSGAGMPGLAVLGSPEYTAFTPLILVAAALLVSVVAAFFGWRLDVLDARRAAAGCVAERRVTPPSSVPARSTFARPRSILGARLAGRSPPLAIVP